MTKKKPYDRAVLLSLLAVAISAVALIVSEIALRRDDDRRAPVLEIRRCPE